MQESSIAQLFSIVKYTRGQGKHFVKKLVGTLGVWYIDTKQKERQEDSYGRIFDQRYYKRRAESLGYMEANCDGCSSGLAEMYQAYIDGEKELRDINMEFHAGYVSGEEVPGRRSCPM